MPLIYHRIVTYQGYLPFTYKISPLLEITVLYQAKDFFFFLSKVPFPLLSLST